MIYAGGVFCSGTRLLFDLVRGLGLEAIHAPLPGHHMLPGGEYDAAHPVWWMPADMERWFGAGRWVIISRRPAYGARSAVRKGLIASVAEYPALRAEALRRFARVTDAHRLTYENLVADTQVEHDRLADWLGVRRRPAPKLYDANAKYR